MSAITYQKALALIRSGKAHPIFGGVHPSEFHVGKDNSTPPQTWLWRGDRDDSAEPWARLSTRGPLYGMNSKGAGWLAAAVRNKAAATPNAPQAGGAQL